MSTKDPHRFSHQLDTDTTERIIHRLESRANDKVFTKLFDQYTDKLVFSASGKTLEVGCGTGAMSRALARKKHFQGKIVGIDQCDAFVQAASGYAAKEGVIDQIEFYVGDVHELEFEDESFDTVIAHTVISHVTNPESVIKEITRVLKIGGTIAIFDGDYASLTYGCPDHELGRRMDSALATTTFNNPLIMRDLIRILPALGLEVTDTITNVVSEIGHASYFKSFAETYVPMVKKGGLLPEEEVDAWFATQLSAMNDGTFFAACNYYTYLAKRIK